MNEYEKIKSGHRLRRTTQDLLYLMYQFGKLHEIKDVVKVHLVNDQLQQIETDTCGMFQLYFYFNLFMPFENNSIIKDTKLSKKTIEKLLNEIFLSIGTKTKKKSKNSPKKKISRDYSFCKILYYIKLITICSCPPAIFFYRKLLALDSCQIDILKIIK